MTQESSWLWSHMSFIQVRDLQSATCCSCCWEGSDGKRKWCLTTRWRCQSYQMFGMYCVCKTPKTYTKRQLHKWWLQQHPCRNAVLTRLFIFNEYFSKKMHFGIDISVFWYNFNYFPASKSHSFTMQPPLTLRLKEAGWWRSGILRLKIFSKILKNSNNQLCFYVLWPLLAFSVWSMVSPITKEAKKRH